LRGEHAPSLEVLASEHDNLRAALAFLTVHDPPRHLELARDLGLFWHLKGHWEEALERLRRALELAPEAPAGVRATALLHLGRLHFFLGAEEDARRELEEGLLLARRTADGTLVARLLEAVAQARMKVGSDASANEAILEALPLARMSGDPAALAEVLVTLGAARAGAGAYAEARAALEEGLALSRASANGLLLGRALYYRGGLALLEGTPEREPLAGAESADTSWSSHILEMRGRVLAARGAVREAIPLVEEGLVSLHDVGSHACLPHSLEGVARLALAGDPRRAEAAARLLGAAERACETLGVAMLPVERALSAQTAAAVRAALPAPAFEAAWREGRGWSAEEAYRRARALLTEL
jgi:tetratricopeptide (TPR) repeat protein